MISYNTFCWFSVILFLNLTSAKPLSDHQNPKQLLEEDRKAPYYASEETERKDLNADKSVFEAADEHSWNSDVTNSALSAKENALALLIKDIMRTSKRSWSRYKKGGMRSCFGVRLERIGSFSGLGC